MMRITPLQQKEIKKVSQEIFGKQVKVVIFGSRAIVDAKGGDLDILIETDQFVTNPAEVIAKIGAKVVRILSGRKTDILLMAPNLPHEVIHDIAQKTGVVL